MTNLEVHIVSKEMLKPSSPTPPHLSSYKFSLLEQVSPTYYTPLILFYNTNNAPQSLQQLKQSLSETLTQFFPLAGRLKDNMTLDCNDEGIMYVEARVDGAMMDFLKKINIEMLEQFLPCKKAPNDRLTEVVQAAIQVTFFQLGGIAIGGCFGHKITDAASICCFFKTWAANFHADDLDEVATPLVSTDASSIFPPLDILSSLPEYFVPNSADDTIIVKRFVFSTSAIRTLISKGASELVPKPTRVQVLSAFIWKHALRASNKVNSVSESGEGPGSLLVHTVNARKPSLTALSKNCIGSLVLPSFASCDWDQREEDIRGYVGRVHQAISKVNKEHVSKFRGEEAMAAFQEDLEILISGKIVYLCTSWCKLGVDIADFGWGKPAWVSPWSELPTPMEKRFIMLMDINGGDAIEAWLVLDKQEMSSLESDHEFLEFAIPVSGMYT